LNGEINKNFKKVLTYEKGKEYNDFNLKNASVDEEEYVL